ncbi:copine-8-like [Contarinia nasturtii]|uniref:copine-8-like n=1 Tax=Contarinia nasturtii TaxID=265458 RepID=UPI0012D48EDE|nr:copine-8-like [Contarinia nasturtii]
MSEQLVPFINGSLPTSQVELSISGRNLLNRDYLSKSDPYCVVSLKAQYEDEYHEIERTEMIKDSLNPQWVKKVVLDYNFETIQKLRFVIRDDDFDGGYDLLGCFETTLSELVSLSNGRQFFGKLKGESRQQGEIIIVTEELMSCKQIAEIQFRAEHLPKPSFLSSNDPFLVLSRSNEDGSYSVVAKTETVPGTQNPTWKPITIRATTLCNGDFDRNIKIDCYNQKHDGNHKLIGTCYSSLRSLSVTNEPPMILVNEKKKKENGELKVQNTHITEDATFLDYLRGGTQIHFAIAIDFTASNGVHTNPHSLHYLSANKLNNYEIALRGVGEIISYYDSHKLFPAFGFGARLPPNGQVSHQFPLNDKPSHPYCSSIEEILVHYRRQLNTVHLHGPTNFAPVINNTISIASQFQEGGGHYFVLLIITDGIISDMHQTKQAIIKASTLPISIIIVGVGDDDFENMNELDSDDSTLREGNLFAKRDIVQFVPLRRYLTKSGPNQYIKSQADLAKEVLAEIPAQLTGYMKSPNAPFVVPTAPII